MKSTSASVDCSRHSRPGLGQWAALVTIGCSWAASLLLPAVEVAEQGVSGWQLLIDGWRAGALAWYANPLFLAGWVVAALRRHRVAGALSAASTVVALTSLAAPRWAQDAGVTLPALEFQWGFYLWLAANAALSGWSWGCVVLGLEPRPPGPQG